MIDPYTIEHAELRRRIIKHLDQGVNYGILSEWSDDLSILLQELLYLQWKWRQEND